MAFEAAGGKRLILSGSGKRLDSIRMKGIEDQYHELGLKGKEKIKSLSRGNKQKLGIFTAVITEPRILILDEPTSALDPELIGEVLEVMKELAKFEDEVDYLERKNECMWKLQVLKSN